MRRQKKAHEFLGGTIIESLMLDGEMEQKLKQRQPGDASEVQ